MKNDFDRNFGFVLEENDNRYAESIASAAEQALEYAMDISDDIEAIGKMTPDDGFRLKLETIKSAEDMSSKEKLEAIADAEDKYASDKERCAKLHMWLKARNVAIALSVAAVIVGVIVSPPGQKTIKNVSGIFLS